MSIPAPIAAYLEALRAQEGYPYTWPTPENYYSGKGLSGCLYPTGRDCSGAVTFAIHAAGGPDLRSDHSSRTLWKELMATDAPLPGDLVFYGQAGIPGHVMTLMDDGRVLGATGGNRLTTSPTLAKPIGACVRYRSGPNYRTDKLGFRVNPLRPTE